MEKFKHKISIVFILALCLIILLPLVVIAQNGNDENYQIVENENQVKQIYADEKLHEMIPTGKYVVGIAVSSRGIIVYLILLALSLIGFIYYAHFKRSRTILFWILSIIVCVLIIIGAYVVILIY